MPERKFWPAEEPASIGANLVKLYHPHLTRIPFVYLFRAQAFPSASGHYYAKIRKLTGPSAFLIQAQNGAANFHDFVLLIEFVAHLWESLPRNGMWGIVDHELLHAQRNSKNNIVLVPHFNEEFPEAINRWGFYLGGRREYAIVYAQVLEEERAGRRPDGVLIDPPNSESAYPAPRVVAMNSRRAPAPGPVLADTPLQSR
ncbi:MAG: putative metallopeptidase [Blastocatellia bacterium]